MNSFQATVSAFCYSFVAERCLPPHQADFPHNRVTQFVLEQHRRMPDYLRLPIVVLTWLFDLGGILYGFRRFHRLEHSLRWRQIEAWRQSRLGFCREFVRFYESLMTFAYYSEKYEQPRSSDVLTVELPAN